MRLGSRFRRGLRWSAVSVVISSGMQFFQLLLLARLLDKADFGKFAAASLFFQICLQIQETGINNTILHRQESDSLQLSALFWFNALLGILLGILLWVSGGAISGWYGDNQLTLIIRQFAWLLPLVGAAVTFKVLHQQKMDYRHIGIVEITASAASFFVALGLALNGSGLKALVFGMMVRYSAESLLYIMWKPLMQPKFYFRLKDVRFYLRHGLFQSGERLFTTFASQIDTLLIGRMLGMDALGIYDVIKRLLVRPSSLMNHIVERVSLPLYARLQHRKGVLKKAFFLLLKRIATIHFFVYGMVFILATSLMPAFLGKEWVEQATTFQLVAAFVYVQCLLNPVDSLLIALGKIEKWLWANLLILPILIAALFVGCRHGLEGVILSQIVVYFVFFAIVFQVILGKQLGWEWKETINLLWYSIKPALIPLALTILLFPWMQTQWWVWGVVVLVGGLLFYKCSDLRRW